MLNRPRLCQTGCHPYYVKFSAGDYVTWHGPCPRGACEIMSRWHAQKKAPASIDTGAILV